VSFTAWTVGPVADCPARLNNFVCHMIVGDIN
jgi:hypothetical protein